jgi:hypothetical protein
MGLTGKHSCIAVLLFFSRRAWQGTIVSLWAKADDQQWVVEWNSVVVMGAGLAC